MDSLTISAAAGLRARLESLDLLANNIANSATAGYKADRDAFLPWFSPDAASGDPSPTDVPHLERHWTDHSPGTINRTGDPLDFAIHGRGFFEAETPQGPRWTRAGTFQIDAAGKLRTAEGYAVRVKPPQGRDNYQLNPRLPVEVAQDGTIRQSGAAQGTIEVMDFDSLDPLQKQGGSYFRMDAATLPKPAKSFELKQGYLEGANAGVAESSVRMVSVLRQFEALQKAVAIGAEMNKRAVEDVARPTA